MQIGSQRSITFIGLGVLLLYIAWVGGPYFKSIVARDAAVTTWISVIPAPIGGYTRNPLYPGDRVGADGRIATVEDPQADAIGLARARAELDRAQARAEAAARMVETTEQMVATRTRTAAAYAAAFQADLDLFIANAKANLALTKDNRRQFNDVEMSLKRAMVRQQAAADSVFLLENGSEAGSSERGLMESRLQLKRAQLDLEIATIDLRAAQTVVDAAAVAYEKSRSMDVLVPPDALVWSLISAPGAPVQPGAPLQSWVDCRIMLVDVPASDVEIALLPKGAHANVVLEGEKTSRVGHVLLTRGAAATIGGDDLAALSKGRNSRVGQVIVKLDPTAEDIRACPIGHAAYVDFPDIGVIDILRARLRL